MSYICPPYLGQVTPWCQAVELHAQECMLWDADLPRLHFLDLRNTSQVESFTTGLPGVRPTLAQEREQVGTRKLELGRSTQGAPLEKRA